jgi:hypothetical protein
MPPTSPIFFIIDLRDHSFDCTLHHGLAYPVLSPQVSSRSMERLSKTRSA